ncbi:hypothetical protein SNEBB_010579 [Seison nebaliae]|nr:hypothetical protein SNEBB_010579 [Seison nebaliae]
MNSRDDILTFDRLSYDIIDGVSNDHQMDVMQLGKPSEFTATKLSSQPMRNVNNVDTLDDSSHTIFDRMGNNRRRLEKHTISPNLFHQRQKSKKLLPTQDFLQTQRKSHINPNNKNSDNFSLVSHTPSLGIMSGDSLVSKNTLSKAPSYANSIATADSRKQPLELIRLNPATDRWRQMTVESVKFRSASQFQNLIDQNKHISHGDESNYKKFDIHPSLFKKKKKRGKLSNDKDEQVTVDLTPRYRRQEAEPIKLEKSSSLATFNNNIINHNQSQYEPEQNVKEIERSPSPKPKFNKTHRKSNFGDFPVQRFQTNSPKKKGYQQPKIIRQPIRPVKQSTVNPEKPRWNSSPKVAQFKYVSLFAKITPKKKTRNYRINRISNHPQEQRESSPPPETVRKPVSKGNYYSDKNNLTKSQPLRESSLEEKDHFTNKSFYNDSYPINNKKKKVDDGKRPMFVTTVRHPVNKDLTSPKRVPHRSKTITTTRRVENERGNENLSIDRKTSKRKPVRRDYENDESYQINHRLIEGQIRLMNQTTQTTYA